MKATFVFEFLSRGLLWVRLLLIALVVPEEAYALIALLVTAEALIGNVIAFPQIREVLVARNLVGEGLWSGSTLWVLTLPIQYIGTLLYFESHVAAVVVVTCSLSFMATQILIYMLRVESVKYHNIAKSISALTSSILFFGLVPVDPYLYVVPALISPVAPAIFLIRRKGPKFFRSLPDLRNAWSGWANFGLQGLAAVFWQYGNRFVVGYLFPVSIMSSFMRGYLLASGVTFIYSAVMIVWERAISVEVDPKDLRARMRVAWRVLAMLCISWAIYSAAVYVVFIYGAFPIALLTELGEGIDPLIFVAFLLIFLIRAVQLTLTPIVIAVGNRNIVTISSIFSLIFQIIMFGAFWKVLTPLSVVLIMLGSLLCSVIITGFGLRSRHEAHGDDDVDAVQSEQGI